MKKSVKLLISFLAIIVLTGCGGNERKSVDINKTKLIKFNELSLEIPDLYQKGSESSDIIEFYEIDDYQYDLASCHFSISYLSAYGSIEDELKEELNSEFFQPATISNKVINNHTWTYIEAKSLVDEDNHYYISGIYRTDYNNNRYSFEFNSFLPEKYSCDKLIEKVTNSFRFQ